MSLQPTPNPVNLRKTRALVKEGEHAFYCKKDKNQLFVVVPQLSQEVYGLHIQISRLEVF